MKTQAEFEAQPKANVYYNAWKLLPDTAKEDFAIFYPQTAEYFEEMERKQQ